jgi:hypothetical protein
MIGKVFERYWTHQLSQIKVRAEKKALERLVSGKDKSQITGEE